MTVFDQNHQTFFKRSILVFLLSFSLFGFSQKEKENPKFKVIAFYTAKNDQAHISFVHEANKYFPKLAEENHFQYDSTSNWENLNAKFLSQYKVVLFLYTRPDKKEQREAFQKYMEKGGSFIWFNF